MNILVLNFNEIKYLFFFKIWKRINILKINKLINIKAEIYILIKEKRNNKAFIDP